MFGLETLDAALIFGTVGVLVVMPFVVVWWTIARMGNATPGDAT
jgi:hypothetical protein